MNFKSLWRKKDVTMMLADVEKKPLKRTLSALDLTFLGVGNIIGTGVFVLTGLAAALKAGPALIISYMFAGLACALTAFSYSELTAMIPVTGGTYTYAYAGIGEFVAWLLGWNLLLEYSVGAATATAGWSGYVCGLLKSLGVPLPYDFTHIPAHGGIVDLPAVLIVLFLSYMLYCGTKGSASFNRVLVWIKLTVVALFLFLAFPKVNAAHWSPFLPFGWEGVGAGAAFVFFGYIGFETVATAAEESKNPQRDLPIGTIASLTICTVAYILVVLALTGLVPYESLNTSEPVAYALRMVGYNFGAAIVAVGAVCGITTVLLVTLYGQSRIIFAISRDGLLPEAICSVHKKNGTPYKVHAIAGLVVAGLAGFTPIEVLAEMANIGTLSAFMVAGVAAWLLRRNRPDMLRPFKCPAINIIVPLGCLTCFLLMLNLEWLTWVRFVIWSGIGIVIYFVYGIKHSRVK